VEHDLVGGEFTFSYEGLDGDEEDGTVGLGNDPDAAVGRISEDSGKGLLGTGMEVELRFFKEDKLATLCYEKGYENGHNLRDTNSNVSDVYEIVSTSF
jgi:hypothetical protein